MDIVTEKNYGAEISHITIKHFLNFGFPVIVRDDERTIEETLELVEKQFYCKCSVVHIL